MKTTQSTGMTREMALPYVSVVLDDSLNVQPVSAMLPNARLVGWQCGFEPMFVAVQSYLPGIRIDDEEAEEIARDYLEEKAWFSGEPRDCDYLI